MTLFGVTLKRKFLLRRHWTAMQWRGLRPRAHAHARAYAAGVKTEPRLGGDGYVSKRPPPQTATFLEVSL